MTVPKKGLKALLHLLKYEEAKTYKKGKKGSPAFIISHNDKIRTLWDVFGDNQPLPEKFQEAFKLITASGLERGRINQLNSSALLVLLCFWNINKKNPISIDNIEYDKVFFEVKNKVFDNPSSVDILLVSKDESTWLYLESKFTEPLTPKKHYWIKEKYFSLYNELVKNKNLGLKISDLKTKLKDGKEEYGFELFDGDGREEFLEGIKQMVSHLIGLVQGPVNPSSFNHLKEPQSIKLGTILYDFSKSRNESFENDYANYVNLYQRVFTESNSSEILRTIESAEKINPKQDISKISVLPEPLTYQEIFLNGNRDEILLLPKVKKYYFGKYQG